MKWRSQFNIFIRKLNFKLNYLNFIPGLGRLSSRESILREPDRLKRNTADAEEEHRWFGGPCSFFAGEIIHFHSTARTVNKGSVDSRRLTPISIPIPCRNKYFIVQFIMASIIIFSLGCVKTRSQRNWRRGRRQWKSGEAVSGVSGGNWTLSANRAGGNRCPWIASLRIRRCVAWIDFFAHLWTEPNRANHAPSCLEH